MSSAKNSILFYLALSPLGYVLLTHLHHTLLPFNVLQKTECRDPAKLFETYSAPGFHDILDRIVCVLVRFCSHAINDPMCFPMTATLMGLATTVYVVMSVERARFNNNKLLAPIMITIGNVIGTGVIAPLAWLPFYGWSLRKYHSNQKQVQRTPSPISTSKHASIKSSVIGASARQLVMPHVEPHQSFGIALAAFFGQFLPVAILVSHGPSLTQRNVLAAFQYFPITFALFEWIVPYFVQHLNCNTKKGGTDSVRLLYTGVASINAFLSYWVWIKWLQTTTAPVLLVKQWISLFFSFGSSGENPVTYMLMWDIVALVTTFTYWAWLEDGKQGVKSIFVNSVLFGPGAGLALYAMKRESRI
jgi:hypothetical protein